jgi:tetratricopeptide (TPR) repeat protein
MLDHGLALICLLEKAMYVGWWTQRVRTYLVQHRQYEKGGKSRREKNMKIFILCFGIFFLNVMQAFPQNEGIAILNALQNMTSTPPTNMNVGPTDPSSAVNNGNILNAHFFPGLLDYSRGNYISSLSQMDYFINRPSYIMKNPNQPKFFSMAHYTRGRIFFYHASGYGRYAQAIKEFEEAIRWDPKNHYAYLELSRVHASVSSKEQASVILQRLLELQPSEELIKQAKKELDSLK